MNSFFIYAYTYKDTENAIPAKISATVIFCSCADIDEKDLQSEIRIFYQSHYQTDRVYVIGRKPQAERLREVFIIQQDQTFKGLPKRQETFLSDSIYLLTFDKDGLLDCINGKKIPEPFENTFKNEGLQKIFISRGGLIVSEASHHYVFPSGKHCDRFLRTGNILLYSPEIYFIAFSLLTHFNEDTYSRIYCDTSSINSIAFALWDLKNSFLNPARKVSIESFSSYDGLYKKPDSYSKDSFLLVSASTSANIIKYILDMHKILTRDNILILYYLGVEADYSNVKDQVLCNLTQSLSNENGIPFYPTYKENSCEFCKRGSYPVPVTGDVFLLEKPKVNRILLSTNDREKYLSPFVKRFMSVKRNQSVFRVNYKERSADKYEIYIDYVQILKGLNTNPNYEYYKDKLHDYIQQYIPSNTRYFLHLNDAGSKKLAEYVYQRIAPNYYKKALPTILDQEHLQQIDPAETGTVVVIGSCISNGKNLLYISRALRKFNKLRIVYFIGITRTVNKEYLNTLKTNLQRGRYGAENNGFVAVDSIYCSNQSKETPWIVELEFLKEIILFIQNKKPEYKQSRIFFQRRKEILARSSGDAHRGLTQDLFFERITTKPYQSLVLRKNFAFFDFDDYDKHITQSDVYFTISNIINSLRYSVNINRQLQQAVYVRNLLDPANFDRYNDGVIQASILRAAQAEELAYAIDAGTSQDMSNTLETIIRYHEQEQGEALLEFLYAIAIKKLSLTVTHLKFLLDKIADSCKIEIFRCFAAYIREKLIDEPERLRNLPLPPK